MSSHHGLPPLTGPRATQWPTVRTLRRVLFIVHTAASANRLRDVLPIFDSDPRVQLVFTCPGTSLVSGGVAEFFAELRLPVIGWGRALLTEFDLAISANHTGDLHRVRAPLVIISHGIGYTKTIAGSREPGAGSREPGAGSREPGAGSREPGTRNQEPVYGLSAFSLLHEGTPIADHLVLSHPEQRARLAVSVPEAVDRAVLAGDPCLDRLLTSLPLRQQYRAALGADENTTVITISSTWHEESLLHSWPSLFRELLAELDSDRFRCLAVIHPHATFGHGPHQLTAWFADCQRAGLRLIPPEQGWQAALIASDLIIGDFGSTTCFGAIVDVPIALTSFTEDKVAEGSPVDLLGKHAPRLLTNVPLLPQIEALLAEYEPGQYAAIADLISSIPGESASRLRALCYETMSLPEPSSPISVPPIPIGSLGESQLRHARAAASFVSGHVEPDGTVVLSRNPMDVSSEHTSDVRDAHLLVHFTHPTRGLRASADILFSEECELASTPESWCADTLRHYPGAVSVAVLTDEGDCFLARRGRSRVRFAPVSRCGTDPGVWASACYLLEIDGARLPEVGGTLTVRTGAGSYRAVLQDSSTL